MTYVDTALLDLTEWLCRRFQVLTGRTNVWLAFQLTNLSIVVFFVWAGMHFVIARGPGRVVIALFCGGLLYLLARTVFKVPVEEYENSAYRRVAKGLRNPRRIRDLLLRLQFLMMSIVLVLFYPPLFLYLNLPIGLFVAGYGLTVLTTIVLYLLACDPLPPCQGKVREWIARATPATMPLRTPSDAEDSA
jgi:hypothetical protein